MRDIDSWMVQNGLKLNHDKTEVMIFTSRFRVGPVHDCFKVVNNEVLPMSSAKNLGYLCMDQHIKNICKSAHFHLRNIRKIRKYLDKDSTEILVHSFITSKLDNCNSLLYGLPDYQLHKLQLIQNTAARVITGTKKFEHITAVLQGLHWLPISYRIMFKILLLVYKGLHGLSPQYISDMLVFNTRTRTLRSHSMLMLKVGRPNTKTYGDRAFSIAGPTLWNNLPLNIKLASSLNIFKKELKTYLFKLAF